MFDASVIVAYVLPLNKCDSVIDDHVKNCTLQYFNNVHECTRLTRANIGYFWPLGMDVGPLKMPTALQKHVIV